LYLTVPHSRTQCWCT